jgi:pyruvate dehydrogenase E1 component alpha subunit
MTLNIEADLARRLLGDMLLIRRFEEKAAEAYALGKIGGFLHLYIGEEAVAVGATSVLRRDDYAIAAYREHGHCLPKGPIPVGSWPSSTDAGMDSARARAAPCISSTPA